MKKFTNNTDQATKIIGDDYNMLRPHEHYGRRRVHFFEYVIPVGNLAIAQDIALMKIPEGARILGGRINQDAMGAGATADIGLAGFDDSGFIDKLGTVADDDDILAAALDVAAAGVDEFASVLTENYGYLTEKALWVTLTIGGAAFPAGKIIKGEIEIVVD